MTSTFQQPAPSFDTASAAANSAAASVLDSATKAGGTEGADSAANRASGENGSPRAAQVVEVESFLRPPSMATRRLSIRPGFNWLATPPVSLSFGSVAAATAGVQTAQPLMQGGLTARMHVGASAEPPPAQARNESAAAVSLEDWHDLLRAVMERLRLTVSESMGTLAQPHPQVVQGAAHLQSTVLECVLALDQLQGTLAHEFTRREGLQRETQAAQAALLLARNELAHSRGEQRRLHDPAPRDSLATLPNRGVFSKHLERALACAAPQSRTTALLYIDLDGFKAINAAHGRSVGDELLGVVGARLARAVRADDMVSRVGSDEFACLIRGPANAEQIAQLAGKLVDVVSMPCTLGAIQLRVQPSIGVACCPTDGDTAAKLLACADAAMRLAKGAASRFALFSQPGSV